MALIAVTSMLTNTSEAEDESESDEVVTENGLELTDGILFAPEELKLAIEKGNTAIRDRQIADVNAKVLLSPSPSARHQYALNTGRRAKNLSLAAVGELAATKQIENSRAKIGMPSAMGRHFDVGWVPKGQSCFLFLKL